MNIAVIPARGGSKRIPRKNIKIFHGKPMIAWSIETASKAGVFEHIIVSTDDAEIAGVAKEWGAEVPFIRPKALADDYVATTEVMAHATAWAIEQSWNIHAVCCIYATAPFVQPQDIVQGLQALHSGEWDYAFSVTDYAAPIFRAFRQTAEGGIEMFFPDHFPTRSQDLPEAMHDAAQFYWGRPEAWLNRKKIFDFYSKPVIIPRWRVQDIDNPADWERAQMLASACPGLLQME
jgi:N-acylneuraminate cytidylyltransferase